MLVITQTALFLSVISLACRRECGNMKVVNSVIKNNARTILVINNVEATRKSIKTLLMRDGYHIVTAQNEQKAAEAARFEKTDLMLISLDGKISDIVAGIDCIRELSALRENVPTIIFCAEESKEANESNIGRNIYYTCPDNFNNLRNFISRLLRSPKSL